MNACLVRDGLQSTASVVDATGQAAGNGAHPATISAAGRFPDEPTAELFGWRAQPASVRVSFSYSSVASASPAIRRFADCQRVGSRRVWHPPTGPSPVCRAASGSPPTRPRAASSLAFAAGLRVERRCDRCDGSLGSPANFFTPELWAFVHAARWGDRRENFAVVRRYLHCQEAAFAASYRVEGCAHVLRECFSVMASSLLGHEAGSSLQCHAVLPTA
jgi:hypothetical protein